MWRLIVENVSLAGSGQRQRYVFLAWYPAFCSTHICVQTLHAKKAYTACTRRTGPDLEYGCVWTLDKQMGSSHVKLFCYLINIVRNLFELVDHNAQCGDVFRGNSRA